MDTENTEGEFIRSAAEINRILSNVRAKLAPVTIRFPGVRHALTTYIMDIDANRKYLMLDEIVPRADNRIMLEGRPFNLETFHDGCRVRAKDLKAKPTKGADGSTIYRVTFPEQIHFMQRRASYRAQVRRTLEIVARTFDIEKQVVSGLLRDMSAEGCQVQVSGDVVDRLKPHTTPVPVKLYFPNGTSLVLKVELRFVGYNKEGGFTKLGCQFLDLDNHKEREISRVVTDLQRDYINFTKNGGRVEGIPPLFLPPEDDSDIERLDGVQRPPGMTHTEKAEKEARKTRTQKRRDQAPELDVKQVHKAGISAVKTLVGRVRLDQNLPTEELFEAAANLLTVWQQNRERLILLTHIRHPADFIFEHSVGFAVLLVDQASQNDGSLQADELRDLMLAGLCHEVPKALLEDGNRLTTLNLSPEQRKELSRQTVNLRARFTSHEQIPKIVSTILAQHHERLDGSGFPDQLTEDEFHPLGKLAAVLDVLDTNAHIYRDDVYYFPALSYKRTLDMGDQLDAQLIKQTIMRQGLYPLGAPVRLSNGYIGLVMRQTDERKPRVVRLIYNARENSQVPARDVDIIAEGVSIEGHADPVKLGLGGTLLQLPLQIS